MQRSIVNQTKGFRTKDGAGVSLVRVLGAETADEHDPFLMLDAFDSTDPADYRAGFPVHPHRGIETVSFLSKGSMLHRDHLGNEAIVHDGEAQWLTAGSGAFHEEMPQADERLLGTQLWLNMSSQDKMTAPPAYHGIERNEIKEFPFDGGLLRLVTGSYQGTSGWQGKYQPLDFYDIHMEPGAHIELEVPRERSAFLFTLLGAVEVAGTRVEEKTAAKLGEGDSLIIQAGEEPVEVLFYSSLALNEPIAWYGPIVMNTQEELRVALDEIERGTFVKQEESYE